MGEDGAVGVFFLPSGLQNLTVWQEEFNKSIGRAFVVDFF